MTQPSDSSQRSDFGFRDVSPQEKTRLVGEVFTEVAERYDIMNDLMSLGIHRLWKRLFVKGCGLVPGQHMLDLAGGTGDIAALAVAEGAEVTVADINLAMLSVGRARLEQRGLVRNLNWVQANAEALPFADQHFDHVTIAFGLRNVTHRDQALQEMVRVLRPGGQLHIMEFSQVQTPAFKALYDRWSFDVMPWLGAKVAGSADSYQYLAESIRRFPDQPSLADMMRQAGLVDVDWRNLSDGICAIHRGRRP